MTWLVIVWFALVIGSTAYIAVDLFTRTPAMKVMRWGWLLVSLYLGPVALVVYWYSCREPASGTHEKFIAPLWKQSVGSTIHCLAGDATGIIASAAVTSTLGLPMKIDLVVEYVAGFAFGLLVFQALFMKDMLGRGYLYAVRKTVLAEWLSMNAVMAGMIPSMVILMSRNMVAMEPRSPYFWIVMSFSTFVGAVLAYPVNWWLVKNNLKHGMGTERALGRGGSGMEGSKQAMQHSNMPGMGNMDGGTMPTNPETSNQTHGQPASLISKMIVSLITLTLLAAGLTVSARFGDLSVQPKRSGDMQEMQHEMR